MSKITATLRDAQLGLADADMFVGLSAPRIVGQLGLRLGRAAELIERAQVELGAVLRQLEADDDED